MLVSSLSLRADEAEENATISEAPITEEDREHWAFGRLIRPEVPELKSRLRFSNPIDAFVEARLERDGLRPLPLAGRTTLIRRLSFDLTGLPPTPGEVDAFVADRRPGAYERLVDRLLASPAFGERWAQHWLDLARFAETDGFEHDKVRREAWRYRDWVIDALNRDMPYDQFITWQLAGDEVAPDNPAARTATAFCLSGPDMPDINSQEERRHSLLNELTATVGSTLMALQVGCAQCHDHKYDPISQADFYRLRAIFQPAVHVTRDKSVSVLRERGGKLEPAYLMIRGDWRRKGPEVQPGFLRIVNAGKDGVANPQAVGKSSGRRTALARWLTRADHPLTSRVIVNRLWQHHFGHGLCRSPSDFGVLGLEPEHLELLDWLATELVRRKWSLKATHRLMVTSRAYRRASRPSDASWSDEVRKVAKVNWKAALEKDPANELLARFSRRRLEGEAIRDAMLSAAGVLNAKRGGPGVRPPLPAELVKTLLSNQWKVTPDEQEHFRRSIYVFARRNLRYPIFEAFDRPDGNASCPRRSRSTTAPQSLLLLNSRLSLDLARRLAGRVIAETKADDAARIERLYRLTLGRRPTKQELIDCGEFLKRQQRRLRAKPRRSDTLALPIPAAKGLDPYAAAALVDLSLAMLNLSEFIYID